MEGAEVEASIDVTVPAAVLTLLKVQMRLNIIIIHPYEPTYTKEAYLEMVGNTEVVLCYVGNRRHDREGDEGQHCIGHPYLAYLSANGMLADEEMIIVELEHSGGQLPEDGILEDWLREGLLMTTDIRIHHLSVSVEESYVVARFGRPLLE